MNFSWNKATTTNPQQKPGCLLGFALFWMAFSSVFLIIGLSQDEIGIAVVGGIFVLIGFLLFLYGLLVIYIRARVGAPEFTISKTTLKVGEPFNISYYHSFKGGVNIKRILVQFYFQETATYQQGTDTRTVRHKELIEEFEEPGGRFNAGTMIQKSYDVRIPPDGMHTLNVRRNQLQWFVKFQMAIPRLPDFVNEYELEVLPALYRSE